MSKFQRRRASAAGVVAAATLSLIGFAASPAAASARGCTGNAGMTDGSGSVCLDVTGSKLKIDRFTISKKSNNRAWKDKPVIVAGSWSWTGPMQDARRTQTVEVSQTINRTFPNNTKMCGYWSQFPGKKACITIHN